MVSWWLVRRGTRRGGAGDGEEGVAAIKEELRGGRGAR